MSRETIFSGPKAKTLTAEDLPARHKTILHLVTETNFLTNDHDFSLVRPFSAVTSKHQSRRSAPDVMFHLDREQVPGSWNATVSAKRTLPQSEKKLASNFNPFQCDSTEEPDSKPRKSLSKQAEAMIQGRLLLRSDLPVPQSKVSSARQARVGTYMNSHMMKSSMRQRGINAPGKED